MMRTAKILGGLAAVGCLLGSARAHACSGPTGCEGSGVFPLGETMPASATALEWASPLHVLPATGVRLERLEVAMEAWVDVPVDVTLGGVGEATIRPRDGFLPDTRYRLTTPRDQCPARVTGASQAFRTVGAAPLPTTLGTLTATAPAQANVQQRMFVGGRCAYEASAMTSVVSVALSAEAAPWASMLSYEVRVDGEPFVGLVQRGYPAVSPPLGGTHSGRGLARLAVICGPSTDMFRADEPVSRGDGLAEGEHEVVFRARVVGTTTVVETAPVRVTLRCPPVAAVDAGTVAVDAGGATVDAGSTADTGGGSTSMGGCTVTTRTGGYGALWALAGAVSLLARRRRRAR